MDMERETIKTDEKKNEKPAVDSNNTQIETIKKIYEEIKSIKQLAKMSIQVSYKFFDKFHHVQLNVL